MAINGYSFWLDMTFFSVLWNIDTEKLVKIAEKIFRCVQRPRISIRECVRLSVCPSVHWFVCPLVRWSVHNHFFTNSEFG